MIYFIFVSSVVLCHLSLLIKYFFFSFTSNHLTKRLLILLLCLRKLLSWILFCCFSIFFYFPFNSHYFILFVKFEFSLLCFSGFLKWRVSLLFWYVSQFFMKSTSVKFLLSIALTASHFWYLCFNFINFKVFSIFLWFIFNLFVIYKHTV